MQGETVTERILVVDDEETIREVVCSMLASEGYQCEEAQSGNAALSVLDLGHQFDIILTGFMMPDLDGLGLPYLRIDRIDLISVVDVRI